MAETLDILDRLVGFDTVSARSNHGLIDYVHDYLGACGLRMRPVPNQAGTKSGLCAEIGPAGDDILLSGNMDVLPIEGQHWTRDPFKLAAERF